MKDYHPSREAVKEKKKPVRRLQLPKRDLPFLLHYFFLVCAVLLVAKLAFHLPDFLSQPPNTINVHGNKILTEYDVKQYLDLSTDHPWFNLDPYELSIRLRNHPWIEKALIHRTPPLAVDVHITERIPTAFLQTANRLFLLGEDYRVLKRLELNGSWDLPIIVNRRLTDIKPGDELQPRDLKKAFQLITLLREDKTLPLDAVSEVIISDPFNIVLVTSPDGIPIKFGFEKFEQKLKALSRLMPQITKNRKRIKYIDLRYIRGAAVKYK